jgi:hypothetical protein
MLILISIGVGMFESYTIFGFMFIAAGFGCFLLGKEKDREDAQAIFFGLGLIGMVVVLVINAYKWLTG